MATKKFELASPYLRKQLPPPAEDVVYLEHLKDLNFTSTTAAPVFGLALFGVGRAGTIHLSNAVGNRRIKVLYIVDDDTSKLEKIKLHYNLTDTKLVPSSETKTVLSDPKVKFIVCASPTITHEKIVTEALKNNKAVFCEKPIAESIEKSQGLYEYAKKVKQPLLSAFNRRFDDSYNEIKEKVRRGDIGKVLTIKVCSRDSPLPALEYLRISGGIFHDCAVHDIDQIISVLGEYPTKISAFAKSNIPEIAGISDVDTVAIMMSFDSGTLGMIDLSRQCVYGYDQRLEVFGEKGMLKAENKAPMQNLEEYTAAHIQKSPIFYSFASRYQTAYANELEHFLDVLEGKSELMVKGEDLLAVSKIATASEESFKTGKVVDLKWN